MSIRWAGLAALVIFALGLRAEGAGKVGRIEITGAIGPASAGYVSRAVDAASEGGFDVLIIQLDTPGGLLDSTKVIVKKLLASPVPIVVYVAPEGSSAGSAGCFITLAADIAAMAPATNIGAAHPVQMGGGAERELDETMKKKLESYAASYIASIAARRQRNVEWAISAVKESASISAEKALDLKVIDLIAKDPADLLTQIHGRVIHGRTLDTRGAEVVNIDMTLRERVFQMLWRPEVLFILMLAAVYGIIGELSNPGAILPGLIGAIALILALYMAAVLPINVAGVVLIAIAMGLFIVDIFAPTHGILTIGGIVTFIFGSLMLFDRPEPVFRLSLAVIIPATVLTATFFIFVVGAGLRAQILPVRAGRETMIGKTVSALTDISDRGGKVFIEGETWNAISPVHVEAGQPVEVVGVQGLTLTVKAGKTFNGVTQ